MVELRALAQGCLAPGARLRTSRGRGLYVTGDLSARDGLAAAGFAVWQRGDLLEIGLGPDQLGWVRAHLPPAPAGDHLLNQLSALADRAATAPEMNLLEEALKMDEPGGLRRPDFEKRLRQQAALCLRRGAGGGALALAWRAAIKKEGTP